MRQIRTIQTSSILKSRLANDANIVLPHGDCCATRAGFHCECPNCGVRFCSEACMEEAYRAWHKTLCLRSRDPDPAHPLLNLVSRVRTHFAGMVATQEQGHIMI